MPYRFNPISVMLVGLLVLIYPLIVISCAKRALPDDWPVPELRLPSDAVIVGAWRDRLVGKVPTIESSWNVRYNSGTASSLMIDAIEESIKALNYRRYIMDPQTHSYTWVSPDSKTQIILSDKTWMTDYGYDYELTITKRTTNSALWNDCEPIQ